MECPECGDNNDFVVDSRDKVVLIHDNQLTGVEGQAISALGRWRRRECASCGTKFNTLEVVDYRNHFRKGRKNPAVGELASLPVLRAPASLRHAYCAACRQPADSGPNN